MKTTALSEGDGSRHTLTVFKHYDNAAKPLHLGELDDKLLYTVVRHHISHHRHQSQ
jgi:hypothetical protein